MRIRNKPGNKKTICSKCGNPLDDTRINKQRYCKECHASYMRINRPRHSELSDVQRKKANCRSYLNVYIRRGRIIKQPCMVCGKPAEAHHNDYDKPLEAVWLCRDHHLNLHKQLIVDTN